MAPPRRRRTRPLRPGAVLAAALLALALAMERGRAAGLPPAAVDAAGLAHFAILFAAPLLLHPLAFFAGAGGGTRVLAALLPALARLAWEVGIRLGLGHGALEALYLALALPSYLVLQLLVLEIVLAEALCRAVAARRRRRQVPSTRPVPRPGSRRGFLVGAAATLAWIAADPLVVFRYFTGFQRGYRALFGRAGPEPAPGALPGPLPAEAAESAPESALEGAPAARTGARRPPNLVVILSDDHRADALGCAGHPFVETPALDGLAAEGLRFRRAFVTTSLCSPSRGSFLTGLYPHRHGVIDNVSPWSSRNRTFFEPLARAGYRCAFVGKWHMPGGLPELRGVDPFVTFTAMGGQGLYHDCPLVVNGEPEASRKRYIAEELTDRALAFLEERSRGDAPFALLLSHKNVHAPFTPDVPEQGRYADAPVELPPDAHAFTPWSEGQQVHFMGVPLEAQYRRYAECVASMDREIGRLLAGLASLGLEEETAVLYASDNGYLWGEHGLVDKRWALEPSIRVPWILRAPGRAPAGALCDRLVTNIDLAPTLLDLAGLEVPAAVQGRSLRPLLRDPEAAFRDAFYYAYFFEPPYPVPTVEAVRTERYKYVAYRGLDDALYDLEADPHERESLLGTPEGERLAPELRERLRALRAEAKA